MKGQASSQEELKAEIERYASGVPEGEEARALRAFQSLKQLLNSGAVRAAEPGPDKTWRVNRWVKSGILLGFRLGRVTQVLRAGPFPFFD